MHVSIRTIAAAALVALLVPVAAVAKDAKDARTRRSKGRRLSSAPASSAVSSSWRWRTASSRSGSPTRAGYIGVLDIGGDLKIRCVGTGRVKKTETENGDVYFCAGRQGGQVILLGSHFKFRGFAKHYRALLPAATPELPRPLRPVRPRGGGVAM